MPDRSAADQIEIVADHLNDTWPHLFNDGFQDEVAREVVEALREADRA